MEKSKLNRNLAKSENIMIKEQLQSQIQALRRDPVFTWSSSISLVALALSLIILVLFWRNLPPEIPFFFSLPWGEEQLTSPLTLIFLIFGTFFLYLTNILLALFFHNATPYYARMLIVGSTICALLTVVTTIRIIFLIT
jgi:hypothetical protein